MFVDIQNIQTSLTTTTNEHIALAGDQKVDHRWRDNLAWVCSGYLSTIASLALSIALDVRAIREKLEKGV